MKSFIAIAALVASAQASLIGHGISTGSSVNSRSEDGLGNYKFSYDEKHSTGGTSRSEAGNPHGVVGSYSLVDIDGRQRIVNYVADGLGFRASVKTNEPGTATSLPAAASISAPGVIAKHVVAAPVVAAASVAAPVIAAAPWGNAGAWGHAGAWGNAGAWGAAPLGASWGLGINHASPVLAKNIW